MMRFRDSIRALCDAGVEFVIIGGVSANLHGSARLTFDLDICYSRAHPNIRRLETALAPYHPRPKEFPGGSALHTDFGAINLFADVAGLGSYDDVKAHSILVDAFDRRVATLDLPALITAKRAAGRDKDIEALKELESLLEADAPPQ